MSYVVPTVIHHRAPIRGTQSFVHTMSSCWRRPSLTALEILWRWAFGIPTLLLLYTQLTKILAEHPVDTLALQRITLLDPQAAAATIQGVLSPLVGPVLHSAYWLVPLIALAWLFASAAGRTRVLLRADRTLHSRFAATVLLHLVRLLALVAILAAWYFALRADATFTVTNPIARGEEPSLVLYSALVIIATLAFFSAWAIVSWIFSAAPLLAMRERLSAGQSIQSALRLGPIRSKLVEINLVMGIVRIALIVLAMVLSACPLPFESVATPDFMARWYVVTAVLYLVASDFFHVVHLVAYLDLWSSFKPNPAS